MTSEIYQPLTFELLRERTSLLFDEIIALGGPAEEIVFERVTCDGCGLTINLLVDEPRGWWTTGNFEGGWRDKCPACAL